MWSLPSAHEIVHELYHKKCDGLILKFDYEKAYDRVNWIFFSICFVRRGFGAKWVNWMKNLLYKGSVGVRINEEESNLFEVGKGLRQGDPLSPLLFNLVADVFTRMLEKAAGNDGVRGLKQ